jgi:hypothetical protein
VAPAAVANRVAWLISGDLSALLFSQVHRDQNSCDIVLFPEQVSNFEASADGLVERAAIVVGGTYHQCTVAGVVASNIFMRDLPITFLRVGDRNNTPLLIEQGSSLNHLFRGGQGDGLAQLGIALAADGLQSGGGHAGLLQLQDRPPGFDRVVLAAGRRQR